MRQVTLLTFMIPVGLMVSASILVGNNIGANKVEVGKAYAHLCVRTAAILACGTILLLILLKVPFVSIFSHESTVQSMVYTAWPIMCVYVFVDCVQCVGQGIIRGLGKQGVSSIGTVIGYWVLGIPISLLAVFKLDWGITGLWLGPTTAITFNLCFYYGMVVKTNWQKVADTVQSRRNQEKK